MGLRIVFGSAFIFCGLISTPLALATSSPLDRAASLRLENRIIDAETREFLDSFSRNPPAARRLPPMKFLVDGETLAFDRAYLRDPSRRGGGLKTTEAFQVDTARERSRFCSVQTDGSEACLYEGSIESFADLSVAGRRAEAANDKAENLVDNGRITSGPQRFRSNLFEIANEDLTHGEVRVQPWSSDYWPIAIGITSKRYADPNFPVMSNGMAWHQLQPYIENWFARYGADVDQFMNLLSPAEKYDILIGDRNFTLSKQQRGVGRRYAYGSDGQAKPVETWMGICHGWAIAAYMDFRPRSTITAHTPGGRPVEFRPDDLKALSVLKWANGRAMIRGSDGRVVSSSRFVGGRCNVQNGQVERDPASGAIIDDNCFDTNPGTFHKALVNQLGVMRSSFVMDATFDYEVWNQPLVSYRYTYFNPQTLNPANTIRDAMVPFGFAGDRFGQVRWRRYNDTSARPAKIVGIIMEATYVVETSPRAIDYDSEDRDELRTVRYKYDLELGPAGEILGGEWYSGGQPDFLWSAAPGSFAWNDVDESVRETISAHQAMPVSVANIARQASARGIVLKGIVDGLLDAAK